MKTSPFFLLFQWALAAATFAALGVPAATAQQVDIKSYGARCDGSDDSAAVQAALNAVSSGTVVISCSAGIGPSGIVLQNKSNVTVMGNGGNAGFRALASTGQGVGNFSSVMFAVRNCTNCVVKDLVIDAQNKAVDSIGFDYNTNSTIQNVQVYNTAYPANAAIVAANGHGNKYLDNTVKTCQYVVSDGTRGMWIGNNNNTEYSATISNNTVSDTGWTGIATHVINATITNNLVYNTHGAGIKVVPPPGEGGTTTVSGNTLRGNQFHGVQVDGADSAVNVLNNTIDANQLAGVYVMGAHYVGRISGNTITNHPQAAVYMYNSEGSSVDNNQISGNGHGVLIEADGGFYIHDIQITSNTITNQQAHGITFWGRGGTVQTVSITGNSIYNNAMYGLFIEQQSGNLTGISASSNCFSNDAYGTIFDNRGQIAPVASSASCSPAGGGSTTKDTTAPTVQITAPGNGSTVSGTVTLTATASDNVGVAGVQYLLNGAAFGAKLTSAPYSVQWDTKTAGNGTYQWNAVATDAAGNSTTSATVFTMVANADTTAPTVQITSPANGATVSGTVSVTASASDNIGVAGVQYTLDGAALGAELTASPYAYSWSTASVAAGSHTLTATARDAAGNRSASTVTVKIADTTAPTVKITAPTAGQTVSGTVNLTATASDNVGVAGVQFLVDGAAFGSESTSGYSVSCNTTSLSNGAHTVSAVARDAGGNKTTAATVSITISNSTSGGGSTTAVARVNAGGPAYTDPSGNVWSADTGYSNGQPWITNAAVANTTMPGLYSSLRFFNGALGYQFTVANGTYTVNLKFAELYYTSAGNRVMNIAINGSTVLSGFDIVAAAGGPNRAVDKSFTVNVTNGKIAIQMTATADAPQVNGIEILKSTTTAPKTTIRVNAGGPAVTDGAGNVWAADTGYSAGQAWITNAAVANTSTPALYSSLRFFNGTLGYQFTVPNGTYTVNLKFAELYYTSAGSRVMNIAINGSTVLSGFDIVAAAGGQNRAVDKAFTVNVTNGTIAIQMTATADAPQVNAIEIYN